MKYYKQNEIIKKLWNFCLTKMKWNLCHHIQSIFHIRKDISRFILSLMTIGINFIERAVILLKKSLLFLGAEKIFCCKATKCHSAESVVERLVLSCGRHSREPPIMRSFGNLFSTRKKKHTRLGCVFLLAQRRGFEPPDTFPHHTISNRAP